MDWLWMLIIGLGRLVSSEDLEFAGTLGAVDHVRAEAFASGEPELLDRVYVPGSTARQVDAKLIDSYHRRGARVVGAGLELLSCRVLRSSQDRVRLEVVDRLADAIVVWTDRTTRELPRDLPTHRIVTMVRTAAGWRIAG